MRIQRVVSFFAIASVFFSVVTNVVAQERRPVRFSHKLSDERQQSFSVFTPTQPETLRVLAVMVEFLPDSDPLTTGNGLFDTSTTAGQVIDPPPHDRAYFQNHLLFLQNYWRKVTNGKVIVIGEVVDTVVQLPHPMRYYSPPQGELAVLVQDTWKRVDSIRPSLDFSRYKAFCIFHAGAGRDIDLTSLLTFDPTPYDLPSIYLNLASLRKMFGETYPGVLVNGGRDTITNSMILPETESRLLPTVGGQFLLQLGINGLLAASLGSHLGLPDLFDTRTGTSAIGRFGLMDGQSIFSWNGVFPPEPSAREKYFLNILHVIDVPPGQTLQDLPAVGLSNVGEDTIVRATISAKEYFLVENRNRDANKDGAKITIVRNDSAVEKIFSRDTVGFNAFNQDSLYGVVVDVDEFDWSLPGGVSTSREFFDGGILIWHIDENVIGAAYASNTVNANPDRRGVDLEEADGSQDIGQSYGFLDPGSGSEFGTPLDFWFSGNPVPVYRNEFSPTSYPNSLNNTGANSHITIKNFSQHDRKMQVTVQLGDDLVKPLPGYPKFVGRSHTDNSPQFSKAIFVSVGDSIFAFRSDTALSATVKPGGLFYPVGGRYPVAFVPTPSDTTIIVVGVQDSMLFVWSAFDRNHDGVFETIIADTLILGSRITTSPVIRQFERGPLLVMEILVGDEKGKVHSASLGFSVRTDTGVGNTAVRSIALISSGSNALPTKRAWIAVTSNMVQMENGKSIQLPYSSTGWQVATTENRIIVADVSGSTLLMFDDNFNIIKQFTVSSQSGGLSPLAVGDIDNDGSRDVVFGVQNKLYALNQAGAAVDHFPITLPAAISGAPIIVRVAQDSTETQIVVTTSSGLVAAYSNHGKMLAGFPLAISAANDATLASFGLSTAGSSKVTPVVVVADESGFLSAWELQAADRPTAVLEMPWGSYRGNTSHTGSDLTPVIPVSPSADFFPASRAYNWPNPVYDGKTYIRYFVRENATVRIKIFDLAGELVDEFTGPGVGGFDNEVEWNASTIQSGVYFAHIEAHAGPQRGAAVIKIAVVK